MIALKLLNHMRWSYPIMISHVFILDDENRNKHINCSFHILIMTVFPFLIYFRYLQVDISPSIHLSWSCSLRINSIWYWPLLWVRTRFMVDDTVSIISVLLSSYLIWRIRMIADQRNVLMFSALSADNDIHL